jgi:adenosine deaminase
VKFIACVNFDGMAVSCLSVALAGEEGLTVYIWQDMDLLKVYRIDQGVCCIDDGSWLNYWQKNRFLFLFAQCQIVMCVFIASPFLIDLGRK